MSSSPIGPPSDCAALIADAAAVGVDVNEPPPDPLTDDALMCFVRWCRENHPRFVYDPMIARRVLSVYRNGPADG